MKTNYWLYPLSVVLGAGSLVAFAVFIYTGPLHIVDLGLPTAGILAFDAALSLAFFLQHSAMTRSGFRRQLSSIVREPYYPAIYSASSDGVGIPGYGPGRAGPDRGLRRILPRIPKRRSDDPPCAVTLESTAVTILA